MAFTKTNISLSESGQFPKWIIDYINKSKHLQAFYTYEPDITSFKQAIEDRKKAGSKRELLADVLTEQYKKTGISDVQALITQLKNEHTFTVCTGHQLCLFTGPLYFIYKLISTINLAQTLKKEYPSYEFIPVYWMATEDHDFEEISSIHLFGKTIKWNNPQASGAVGRLETATLKNVLEELQPVLGNSAYANQLRELFTKAYQQHTNLADATRWLVHELFKEYDLLIIDGDHARLKSLFSTIVEDDLLHQTNYKLVNQTISELEKQHVKAQVNPRPINLFYMKEHIRERIDLEKNETYKVLNTDIRFTRQELLEELKSHPERFSPNVVLRPLYQQLLLPNLAYVGGPGELAYWLEYKAMFDHHHILFPVLLPRNFALMLDEKMETQLLKVNLTIQHLFKDTETLIKELVSKNSSSRLSLADQQEKLAAVFSEISSQAAAVDSTLKAAAEAEFQKASNAIKNIESKIMRSEKQKQETGINQVKKLKEKLFPQDALQERYDNFIPYYLKYGDKLIRDLKETFSPFEYQLLILKGTEEKVIN